MPLLFQENIRTANVRAETFTDLQVMHAEDFKALAEVFPEFKVCSLFGTSLEC